MEQTECSETSAYKIQTPGNYPEENIKLVEVCSRKRFCCGEAVSITYSECVSVVLVILHLERMRRVMLSLEASLALQCFSTLSYERCDCRKNVFGT